MNYRFALPGGVIGLAMLATPAPVAAQYPTRPPAPMTLRPAALPPFQETTLANGVRVVLVENHRNPTVVFRLAMPAGSAFDPPGKSGTSALTAALLTKGAGARTADQIAAAIERAGGSLLAVTDDDYLSVYGSVLSDATSLAFELLGDVVARPTLGEPEFELARSQTLAGLQLSSASPAFLADKFLRAGLYGAHPYGATATPGTVRNITRTDVQQFYEARLRPTGALLVVAGDISMRQVRSLAEKALAGWTGTAKSTVELIPPRPRDNTEIVLVHRPGSVQSNILVGNLAVGPADPARYAAELATQVVGGGSDGRLFKTLREEKGWTYGAYATLTRPLGIGRFQANAEVRTEVTDSALTEILAQLERVGAEPVSPTEMENKQSSIVGSFPLAIETPQNLAALVAFVRLYGLPANYLQTFRSTMSKVTARQVTAAAQRVVRPKQALIVVVGDGVSLYEKLAHIASVTIRSVDGDVLQRADLVAK